MADVGRLRSAHRLPGLLLLAAVSGGCALVPEPADGPGAPVDARYIPDAEPRAEPRSRYGNPPTYVVFGKTYRTLQSSAGYKARGIASWYGRKFHGRRTSSGEAFNMYAATAAHRELPLPTYLRVTNLENGRSMVVKVNDRGPFHEDRLIDLSYGAAARLGFLAKGTARVELEALAAGGHSDDEPAPSAPVSTARLQSAIGAGRVFVQLGAFAHRVNAETLRARVAGADILGAHVEPGRTGAGARVYRVKVGPLETGDDLDKVLRRLQAAQIDGYRVETRMTSRQEERIDGYRVVTD